jgi:hypothetical protein
MELEQFHSIFLNHLNKKSEDVARIIALETSLEKWFQGEMAIAITTDDDNYKIMSSCDYNEWDQEDSEYEKLIGNNGVLIAEGWVYKRKQISGMPKCDILFEIDGSMYLVEIKLHWSKGRLKTGKYLDDIYRLKFKTYKELADYTHIHNYITIIYVDEKADFDENAQIDLKKIVDDAIKDFINKKRGQEFDNIKIFVDKIETTNSHKICIKKENTDKLNRIYLISISV